MKMLQSVNPSNQKILGEVRQSTEAEITAAVKLANKAKSKWNEIGIKNRVDLLKKMYVALERHQDEIALMDSTEMGFPISQCKLYNIGDGLAYFKWYLEHVEQHLAPEITYETEKEIHQVFYEPYGTAAIIQPWNFPFCQWSWSAVPALLSGNTVVYKSSEEVPLSARLIEDIIGGVGLPEGVMQFVYGEGGVGEMLVNQDIDLLIFTGSTRTGRKLYQIAGEKFIPALMELGGSAPGIVFEDVDVKAVIETIFWQRFSNCGQVCDGLKRLIVHSSIKDVVISAFKDRMSQAKIGNPLQDDTDFGPLVSKRQLELIDQQVTDAIAAGVKVVVGGKRLDDLGGFYYAPTLLTNVSPEMRVWREEVFGPVLPIVTFETELEAVQLANDTDYGLGAYVYSEDKQRALRVAKQIQAGAVSINGLNYVLPMNPFGGYKQSGMGREHGKFGLHELSQKKLIVCEK